MLPVSRVAAGVARKSAPVFLPFRKGEFADSNLVEPPFLLDRLPDDDIDDDEDNSDQ